MQVVEAFLPGGSLDPPTRALNPIVACIGGVVGPVAAFFCLAALFHSMGLYDSELGFGDVSKGWGIPTATDIALAWMVASQVFWLPDNKIHPAINYLLLMAVIDDAIGLIIIAVFYTDPDHPVKPVWLLLVAAGMGLSYGLRRLKCKWWAAYVLIGGGCCWVSLLKAGVHPALTLVPVVPFMPDHFPKEEEEEADVADSPTLQSDPNQNRFKGKLEANPLDTASQTVQLEELDEDERRDALRRVIQATGVDHDEGLSQAEVKGAMHLLGYDPTHDEVQHFFEHVHGESENDLIITFDELFEWVFRPGTPQSSPKDGANRLEGMQEMSLSETDQEKLHDKKFQQDLKKEILKAAKEEEQEKLEILKLVFERMDIDHEGGLTGAEISKVMHNLGHDEEMSHDEVQHLFTLIHGDKSGKITFDEFSKWFLAPKKRQNVPKSPEDARFDHALRKEVEEACEQVNLDALKLVFKDMDIEHEGGLTVAEITKAMHNLGHDKDMAHGEAQQLFKEIHGDEVGKILFEEFAAWYEHKGMAQNQRERSMSAEEVERDSAFNLAMRKEVKTALKEKLKTRGIRPKLGSIRF